VVAVTAPSGAPDSDGIWAVTAGLPEQVEEAVEVAAEVGGLPDPTGVRNIVMMGMGGSGIGGDVVLAIAGPELAVPLVVSKDYACPAFVDRSSLVIATSFSGNTAETVEAATAAADRGARLICITGGGRLAELADRVGAPVVAVPDAPQPRAAFGALAAAPLVVLDRLGLVSGMVPALAAAVVHLRSRRDSLIGEGGEAAKVARRIGRTIPLIHGGGPLGAAAALRWKCQINENPKCPAFTATQPELCHNEVTGWGQHGDATRQLITLVMLRHSFEHPEVVRRFELVADVVDEVMADVITVQASGEGPLTQLFDLALLGDFVSIHLAAREGIDPGPIPVLDALKQAMAATPATIVV
jgi:glucose/mannose-6-phosphate isomerase